MSAQLGEAQAQRAEAAAEALPAPTPEGWQPRTDAMGQLYYVHVASGASSRLGLGLGLGLGLE